MVQPLKPSNPFMLGSNVARTTPALDRQENLEVNAIMWGGESSQVYFRRGSTCRVKLD